MATVRGLLATKQSFYEELQEHINTAQKNRRTRHTAVVLLQRMIRGYLIRKYITWLSFNAITIQCAFRCHRAKKAYRDALNRRVHFLHNQHYARAATRIQALWRGHWSRKINFCYRRYRRWLSTVTERGERRMAECEEFKLRSRADDLRILEEEARKWLAFVIFKLHHLLRTEVCAGVYSRHASNELSEFEKLLKSIRYTDYMKRLRSKYDEFVRRNKPKFSNKRLFPIIGEGTDYWYMSLPDMYELTQVDKIPPNTRFKSSHHGKIHMRPFRWRKVRICGCGCQEPPSMLSSFEFSTTTPPPTPMNTVTVTLKEDPRFHLYVQYYKPEPDIFDYVDFHVNVLLNRKTSIMRVHECQD